MKKEINANRIKDFLAAGYSGFVIRTTEVKRAAEFLTALLDGYERKDGDKYTVESWDIDTAPVKDPLRPLDDLTKSSHPCLVALLHNYHWFLDKPVVIQKIQNSVDSWKNEGKAIVVITPYPEVPLEIRKDFMILELPLPEEEEIRGCMHHISRSARKPELLDVKTSDIVQAAKGLAKTEIENVLALSYTTTGAFDVNVINEQKIQAIEKTGLIEVLRTKKTYADILGYDKMKNVVGKMIVKRTSKGVLIVGPPGCGKTLFMQCTVGQFSKIGLLINFGRLYSKYQGEGSENVEEIIDIIEAVGDCVVIMDEFEKQFAGAASTGELDSGTSRRMTGRWLTFMQEKPEGVYMMGTCNSFKGIPDEYLRIGRWDSSPFYIDMPNPEEKMLILDYYINKCGLKTPKKKNEIPAMKDWTGAEIEGCCLMAKNLGCSLMEAASYIVPQNKRGFAEAELLKEFAIPASTLLVTNGHQSRKLDAA